MASRPSERPKPTPREDQQSKVHGGVDRAAGFFETAFRACPDSILINQMEDGLVLAASDAFFALTGFSPPEVVGRTLKDLDLWVISEERRKFLKLLQQEGVVNNFLARFRMRDGKERVLQLSARPLEINGNPCAVSVTRDVADLLQVQAELRQKLDELDSIFRAAPTGIGVVVERVIMQANDRLCQMTGYSHAELVGQSARIFYPTEEEYLWVGREKYDQISRLGAGTVETRWQRHDGRIIDVLLSSTPIKLADLSAGVTFTALDITARKEAEREIQDRRAYLAALHKTALNMLNRLDIGELLQTIVAQAASLAGTQNGFISIYDDTCNKMVVRAACGRYGEADIVGYKLDPGEGMAGRVWQTGEPMLIDDYRTWPGRLTDTSFKDLRAAMAVPIRRRQRLVGVIGIGDFEGSRRFGPIEREVIEHFADLVALGLDNAELYAQLQSELQAKAAAEARYRSVFENTGVGTVLSEMDTTLSMVNSGFAKLVGYPREAIEGRMKWTAFVAPEDHARMLEIHHLRRRDPARAPKQFECRLVDREGRRKAVVLNVDLIPGTTTSVGSFMDISRLKETESALRRYEQVVISSSDYLGLVDRDYVFQAVNPAYAQVVGRSAAEIVGRSLADIFGQEMFARYQKPKVDHAIGGQELHIKAWYDTPALGRRFIDTTYYPCRETDGTITGVVIVGRDVTELRRMEAQLLQAQKLEAIGTLAGGIAHDFNNLLMGIQGRTSLMLSETEARHPFQEHLQSIESHVHSAVNLTRQLLGFARGGKYEVRPTDLNELIKAHNRLFSRTRKEISIQGKYARDLWAVAVDQGQINQVLLNLYVNAWQAMPAGGTIYVETRNIDIDAGAAREANVRPGRYVKVSVTDTGLGMDQATCQRVFEPFFTTREMGHGTGLGLASAYGILQNHGGAIQAFSEKGHGATFCFYLPATDAVPETETRRATSPASGQGTILLVDDEPLILDVAAAMLAKLGYTVLRAESGAAALDIFSREQARIDAVVLDMIMPGMGGGATFDRLKAIDPNVRVLLASGYSLNGQASEIIDRGCTGFIQKPFNLIEFSEKLKAVLAPDDPG